MDTWCSGRCRWASSPVGDQWVAPIWACSGIGAIRVLAPSTGVATTTRGRVLAGSRSPLVSTPNNPNTRDYAWESGQPYRLTVRAGSEAGHWTGSVEAFGHEQVIRDLFVPAEALVRPMVWSEVFARCDDPPVSATWRDPVAHTARGPMGPSAYRVSYQSEDAGGCSNTDVEWTENGIRQVTSVDRHIPAGSLVPLHGPATN
jgi:hypothetical protein